MEYGTFIADDNYMSYVGWEYTIESNENIQKLFI